MSVIYQDDTVQLINSDVFDGLAILKDSSVQTVVTSPPYWGLRDYQVAGQIGLEETPEDYVGKMVEIFRGVRRVLKDDGTLWVNLGDSYAGSWGAQSRGDDYPGQVQGSSWISARQIKAHPHQTKTGSLKHTPGLKKKDLIGIPWRVAFALQSDGWYLRQDLIWHKPNPMPESVVDRCTKAHEYIFLLVKNTRYFYDAEAIQEKRHGFNGSSFTSGYDRATKRGLGVAPREESGHRNKRSVWTVSTQPYLHAHFATFPPKLIEPCILAGSRPGDLVLDPFSGTGTTAYVAKRFGRRAVGIELNPEYFQLGVERVQSISRSLFTDREVSA